MHPLVRALLSAWEWRPEVLAVLVPLTILYTLGWRRLRRRAASRRLAPRWRLAAYWAGMGVLAISLMSPVDWLGGQLFMMHMIQHMLAIMLAAPLILLANPFPFVLWALPPAARRPVTRLFTRDSYFRRGLVAVTQPGVAWLVFILVYLGWHDPNAYNAALYYPWVHDVEHITFFAAALLYWYPIIEPAPRLHKHFPGWGKMAYLIGTVPPNMVVGVSIAFAGEVLYTYYLSIPPIWGFTTLQDQQLAGAIMWIVGSQMFIMAALVVLARMFGRKGDAPRSGWDSDEAMIAPGLEGRVDQARLRRLQSVAAPGPDASQPT
jgi:cytochrome c oxidase assembly factor CtaG